MINEQGLSDKRAGRVALCNFPNSIEEMDNFAVNANLRFDAENGVATRYAERGDIGLNTINNTIHYQKYQ